MIRCHHMPGTSVGSERIKESKGVTGEHGMNWDIGIDTYTPLTPCVKPSH